MPRDQIQAPRKVKSAISARSQNGTGTGTGKQKTILSFFEARPDKVNEIENKNNTGLDRENNTKANNSHSPKRSEIEMDSHTTRSPPKKLPKVSNFPGESKNDTDSPTPGPGELTPEQKDLISSKMIDAKLKRMCSTFPILDSTMGKTWFAALEDEFRKEYFKKLSDFVVTARNRATVYPPVPNVWEWTKQYPIQDVKVVILGQDPYHGPDQAHGLCFSVKKGVRSPPSLVNMYKELQNDIPGFESPDHGYLTGWADQGVLLLNAVLTVEAHKANSHKDQGWEKITDAVIAWISKNLNSVVFLLWGSYAQKKAGMVDKSKHHLLQGPHPSPLSAHRGFFGCKHFSKCNELLINAGRTPIDWKHLP